MDVPELLETLKHQPERTNMDNQMFYTIISLLNLGLSILIYLIIAQAVLSWIRPDPNNFFVRLLNKITDPILRPLDRLIPSVGGLSFTPIIAIMIIQLIRYSLETNLLR